MFSQLIYVWVTEYASNRIIDTNLSYFPFILTLIPNVLIDIAKFLDIHWPMIDFKF